MLTMLSILLIWLGIKTLKDNYNRDLDKVAKIEGIVENTQVVVTSKKAGAVPSVHLNLNFLNIRIKSSGERFYTYTPKQEYSELIEKLKIGYNVTIYYRKLPKKEIQNNIFRLDLNSKTILAHEDYKEKEYGAGIIMILLGLFFVSYTGFIVKKKGLKKNWG